MPISTTETRIKRRGLLKECHAIIDKADEEKRSMTPEDRTKYDATFSAASELHQQIEDDERRNALDVEETAQRMRQEREDDTEKRSKGDDEEQRNSRGPRGSEEYRSAYRKYLTGNGGSHFQGMNDEEHRALSAGTGTEGGFLYASEQFSEQLIANVTDSTIFRTMANVLPPLATADSIGNPTLTDRASDAEWTSELASGSDDDSLKFGRRSLTPHPIAKRIKVSKTMLRKIPTIEALVRSELARAVAEPYENAYMTGDGVQKPLGVFTASSDGISTSRDVSSGNTTTAVTFDGLISAKYSIKEAYRAALQWLFHRNVIETVAKLKDGEGQYIWRDSVVTGEPDKILGFPVRSSEFAPNTMTASQYVGMLADYSNYWIIDALTIQIQRLEELYAETNQDGFIIRAESDGAPVREEAFARVQLAAS